MSQEGKTNACKETNKKIEKETNGRNVQDKFRKIRKANRSQRKNLNMQNGEKKKNEILK